MSGSNPQGNFNLEVHGLYILLSRQAGQDPHWGLYHHLEEGTGRTFHILWVSHRNSWVYRNRETPRAEDSQSFAVALKIAIIHPDMDDALKARIDQVALETLPGEQHLTCRTWLLRAVRDPDFDGYIDLMLENSVGILELEAMEAFKRTARPINPAAAVEDPGLPAKITVRSQYSRA